MPTTAPPADAALSVEELARRLRAREPAVLIVRERHLRRLLHRLDDGGESVTVNPELPIWIDRARLLDAWTGPEPLSVETPDRVLLLSAPDDRLPYPLPAADVLRVYWRLVFRGVAAEGLHRQVVAGELTAAVASERLGRLDPAARSELRYVLETDHVVPFDADELTLYRAAVPAVAAALHFERWNLPWVFPSLAGGAAEAFLAASGVPVDALFARTRPEGAADPDPSHALKVDASWDVDFEIAAPTDVVVGRGRLLERAERMARRGNAVRAAILRVRAARPDDPDRAEIIRLARSAVRDRLVRQLADPNLLNLSYEQQKAWTDALIPLLEPAAHGVWPHAARALYDLQRIATDLKGEIATVDPVEWVRSLFRRPLRRPLTRARPVILLRHLSTARGHLLRTPLDPTDRDRLDHLIAGEIEQAEEKVRGELGPVIARVLEEVGFVPRTLPEQIARDKVVAELLDRVCERGFVRIGDLRDAVARNQLKMPDLRGPVEWLTGDPLLRADARLAVELDGVYRRGEVYLRWIYRGTGAAFGTPAGRWLSKYVAFPFGGAFLLVEFGKYLVMEGEKVARWFRGTVPLALTDTPHAAVVGSAAPQVTAAAAHEAHGVAVTPESLAVTLALGIFLLGVLYVPAGRRAVASAAKSLWAGVRFAFATLPQAVWRSPPARWLRHNYVTRFVAGYCGTAVVIASAVAVFLLALGASPEFALLRAGLIFAVLALFTNTPFGRRWEDELAEAVADTWRAIRHNLIPGFVAWVLWAFRELVGLVERGLYTVDEWFRFREGQSEGSLAVKVVLALVWFPVAYVIRFAFYLLLEPQINPVKHFPVVTVSHKLLLPMIPGVAEATGLSQPTVAALIAGIPGIFGFIAWELMANWRLYRANRANGLSPVALGHHGETMRGLLRPGFHSGVVPALFRKLRAAVRKRETVTVAVPAGRLVHGLEEVAHAVKLFVQRDLVSLLRSSGGWGDLAPWCGNVRVGVQSIEVEVHARTPDDAPPLRLAFDHQEGVIFARLVSSGWRDRLDPGLRTTLDEALVGFCEMANAEPPPELEATHPDGPTWEEWEAYWEKVRVREGETVRA